QDFLRIEVPLLSKPSTNPRAEDSDRKVGQCQSFGDQGTHVVWNLRRVPYGNQAGSRIVLSRYRPGFDRGSSKSGALDPFANDDVGFPEGFVYVASGYFEVEHHIVVPLFVE